MTKRLKPMEPIKGIQRIVVCAANKIIDPSRPECDGLIICGARHWDYTMLNVIISFYGENQKDSPECEQGFIDQWGNFLTREEAYVVAAAASQCDYKERVKDYVGGTSETYAVKLFSEDLY